MKANQSKMKVDINKLVREAAPTCGRTDTSQEGRYRVWLSDRGPVVRAHTKVDLRRNIRKVLKEGSC